MAAILSITHFMIFFGGAMSWTMAIGQLMERQKKFFNYVFAALMFSAGVCQFYIGLLVTGTLGNYMHFAFIHLPFLCMTGPTFYFCFKTVVGSEDPVTRKDFLHSLPVILVILLTIPLFFSGMETKMSLALNPPSFVSGNPMRTYYTAVVTVVVFTVLAYMFFFLMECSFLMSPAYLREKKVPLMLMTTMVIFYCTGFIYFIVFLIMNFVPVPGSFYYGTMAVIGILFFGLVLAIYYMSLGSNNYFLMLRSQADERNRYEKSKIKNINLSHILDRLRQLMEAEKIYRDEEISLNKLAARLGIEPYQLSQIINENFNQNFNSYINSHRIEEAKAILLEDKNRTVFSIAYAVGFNSPAPFYEWFQKFTGASPSQFRKKNIISLKN